ncbi:MAG: lamin tail domain-containing protein, partial [Polyangiales bacterium]
MNGVRDAMRSCAWLLVCGCASEPLSGETQCEAIEGDLVITEVHANPDGSDGQDEFIELYNPSDGVLELAGLSLVSSRSDGTGASEHQFGEGAIPARGYYVLGNADPESTPPHINYSYGATLGSLRNSDARLSLWCNDRLIDAVEYARTRDGRSLGFDGQFEPDASRNDDAGHWCVAPEGASEVFTGNFGTPGTPNDECTGSPVVPPCVDDGELALPPTPG